jgi:hypothetical protein
MIFECKLLVQQESFDKICVPSAGMDGEEDVRVRHDQS